jgi:uncharacterized protein YegL
MPIQLTKDQIAELLKDRDYYLMIDRSGSMGQETDTPTNVTRWDYVHETAMALAGQLQQFDPDGITLVLFGNTVQVFDNQTQDKVNEAFQKAFPTGGTNMAAAFRKVFEMYKTNKRAGTVKPNGALLVVITDGFPTDKGSGNDSERRASEDEVAQAIIEFTQTLAEGRTEFGIEIMQVGKDRLATAFLDRLNNSLTRAKYDIVNCITVDQLEGMSLKDALYKSLSE